MKRPKIKECPCCGIVLVTAGDQDSVIGTTVRPICEGQQSITEYDDRGEMLIGRYFHHCLTWHCGICGAKWVHGQFEEAE